MKKLLITTVSALAVLTASQQAFARPYASTQTAAAKVSKPSYTTAKTISRTTTSQPAPLGFAKGEIPPGKLQTGIISNRFKDSRVAAVDPRNIPQHQNSKVGADRTSQMLQAGSGLGVPGGIGGKKSDVADGILKGTGIGKSVMPSGATGAVKDKAGDIKGSIGAAQGRQARDGFSVRQTPGMQKALKEATATPGRAKGVQQGDGFSVRQTPGMQQALSEMAGSRGKEKGVESQVGGGKLTPAQRQAMIDTTVKPKINPGQASDSDDKGKTGTQKQIDKLFKPFEKIAKETKPSPMVDALDKLLKNPPKPPKS